MTDDLHAQKLTAEGDISSRQRMVDEPSVRSLLSVTHDDTVHPRTVVSVEPIEVAFRASYALAEYLSQPKSDIARATARRVARRARAKR